MDKALLEEQLLSMKIRTPRPAFSINAALNSDILFLRPRAYNDFRNRGRSPVEL